MTVYYIFVIIGLLVALVHLMNERMAAEHFDTNKNRARLILSKCTPPNRWIRRGGCWKTVFWNKKKRHHIVQQRCNLQCGRPEKRPVVATKPQPTTNKDEQIASLPTEPSDVPTGTSPPQSEIKFRDTKHKQDAVVVFNGSFHSPTLNFNDTYNKVELLGGGSAKVCSKNYNELCRGTNDNVCTRTMDYCVTLDESNPTMDFRITEHKIGSRIKNDLSSVRIIDDTGSTRVRLSEPTTKRPNVPRELVVRNADKLAWNDAVSSVDFENNKYRLSLWRDDNFRGRNETHVQSGDLKDKREANSIQVYMEDKT